MTDNYLDEVRRLTRAARQHERDGDAQLYRDVLDRIAELARDEHRRRNGLR
jgi:hypothetical protein